MPDMASCLSVGVDYGTQNASAALMLGLGVDRKLYLLDEWRYDAGISQLQLSDQQQADKLCAWLPLEHAPKPMPEPDWIFVDPGRGIVQGRAAPAWPADRERGENDVTYGIRTVASLLGAGKPAHQRPLHRPHHRDARLRLGRQGRGAR